MIIRLHSAPSSGSVWNSPPSRRAGWALLLAASVLPQVAFAQILGSAGSDTIQRELLPNAITRAYGGEGFLYGLSATGIYDSNLFITEGDEESDFSVAVAPWLLYNSAPPGGAHYIFTARYAPFARAYLDHSDLNTVDHFGSASLSYQGAKVHLGSGVSYARFTQPDRYVGGIVESTSLGVSVNGRYELSQKTSLEATWQANLTDYQSARFSSSDIYNLQVTGYWKATPLLRVGPSLRYSETESVNIGNRQALAFLLSLGYDLPGKIDLTAQGGVESEDYERSGSEVGLTGSLGANYAYDALWSFQVSLNYGTVPSPSERNYSIDDLGFRASVTRRLSNGSLTAGAGANLSSYNAVGPVSARRGEESHYGFFLRHRLQLFGDDVSLETSLRFSQNSGLQGWSRLLLSTGARYTF